MNLPFISTMLATLFVGTVANAEPAPPRMVMTWVPPYGIDKCRVRLEEVVDSVGPKTTLTHLALQFWLPTREGGVEKAWNPGAISDATIVGFRDWAHAHGIRVLLCVYNSVDSWDWSLAQAGFAEHREAFVRALVAETERLKLDGIDVDMEGSGEFESSKGSFVAFVHDLGEKLHASGKQITVDTFAYKWNAPNQNWWPELFSSVDGVNSMGYERIGATAKEWRAYAAQKAAAGTNASKLLIGVPSSKDDWLGNTVAEHMDWIARDSDVGVAIWDARFTSPYWQTPAAWKTLRQIRGGK